MNPYLPQSTVRVLSQVADIHRHPGLQLDKFSIPGDQEAQKRALDKVCEIRGDPALLSMLSERRQRILATLRGNTPFQCTTTGPLTLHLSRASALENAGICLHPLYGFAYMPGSGLKGMARAFAETVWLPVQKDSKSAWRKIEHVFGWAPNPDRSRQINDPNRTASVRREDYSDPQSPETNASAGNIIFHDAWPTTWPKLIVDIVNNHHPDYYKHDDNNHPPGDWENPTPVYFLAVRPGTAFQFSLSKRRADVPYDHLALARQWLLGALCHLGAGAKTNAGYGTFKAADDPEPVDETWRTATSGPSPKLAVFETKLELVSPAFLASAEQYGTKAAEGCDLRSATLRGHLRWWWRTMHAGFLDVKTLRALEAAIWGDTHAGGAVRVVIEKTDAHASHPYLIPGKRIGKNKKGQDVLRADPDFCGALERPPDAKTTQGLLYLAFGTDEMPAGNVAARKQRYVIEPPASWRLRLIARPTRFYANRADATDPKKGDHGKPIGAEQALNQAKAALWLLCHFGAVGSKARKGFGSLAACGLDDWSLDTCRRMAEQLRTELSLPNSFEERYMHSPSLAQILDNETNSPLLKEVTFSWPDVWQVLDQIGFAYQAFAKKYKHNRSKMALGLPRRIGQPAQGTFNPKPPVDQRHSSPVHIHIEPSAGGWRVRTVAFPATNLPNLSDSRTFLEEFLKDFGNDLQRRAKPKPPPASTGPGTGAGRPALHRAVGQQHPPVATLPQPGERVEAVLLEERTKKGGWKAKHEHTGLVGPIHNSLDVPGDKKAGDKLALIVASSSERQIAFRYPTAAEEQRAQRLRDKPHGGPGGIRPGSRR